VEKVVEMERRQLSWQRGTLLNAAGDAGVDPYAQYTLFTVLEFGASYGSGGIGGLVQPLIGERVFGTLKPNRVV
jgi:hypothetical protein